MKIYIWFCHPFFFALITLIHHRCELHDYLSDQKLEKSGGQLLGDNGGAWFKLGAWESRIYKIICE